MTFRRALLPLLILAAFAWIAPAQGQDLSGIPGAYVDVGLGVRPLGMGGAYVAVAQDEAATRWNPAALATQQRRSAGFTWTKQMNLIPYNYLSGTFPLYRKGVGYYVEASGDDALRENTIAVGYGSTAEQLPFLRGGNRLSVGLTTKLRWASFGNNPNGGLGQVTGDAIGFGVDFGMLYTVPFVRGLTAGVMLRDAVNSITWDSSTSGQYQEGVPTTLTAGVAYQDGRRVLVTFDIMPALYRDVYTRFAVGGEYRLLKVISLRAGVSQDIGSTEPRRDVTAGLGVHVPIFGSAMLEAGAAYLFDELVNTPRVGLAIRW